MHSDLTTLAPEVLIPAVLLGFAPALIWFFFWTREENSWHKEPKGILALTFLIGMIGVIFVIPIQKYFYQVLTDKTVQITVWAALEEVIKCIAAYAVIKSADVIDEPIDYPLYLIAAGLGFAALENTLYLIEPLASQNTTVALITTNFRFFGSTLLHAVTTGLVGLMVGLSFFQEEIFKKISFIFGLILAIALHTIFNFFIIEEAEIHAINVFAFLWVVSIITLLVFEKVRRMSNALFLETDTQRESLS